MTFPPYTDQTPAAPRSTWPARLTGLGILLLSIALAGSLITYNVQEMGWAFLNPRDSEAAAAVPCTNLLSIPGLYAAGLLYFILGAGALYLCLLTALYGINRLLRPGYSPSWQLLGMGVMVLTSCGILSLQSLALWDWAESLYLFAPGGWLGDIYSDSIYLLHINYRLALILLLLLHATALVLFFRVSPRDLLHCFLRDTAAILSAIWRGITYPFRRQPLPGRSTHTLIDSLNDSTAEHWQTGTTAPQSPSRQPYSTPSAPQPPGAADQPQQPDASPQPRTVPIPHLYRPRPATPGQPGEENTAAQQAPLPPRQTPRRPSVAQNLLRQPAAPPAQQQDEPPLPPSFDEQITRARRQDAERIRMQLPPAARRREITPSQADRDNLLDLMRPAEDRFRRREPQQPPREQEEMPLNPRLREAVNRHMGLPSEPPTDGSPKASAHTNPTSTTGQAATQQTEPPRSVSPRAASSPTVPSRETAPEHTPAPASPRAQHIPAPIRATTPRDLPTEDLREQEADYPLPPYDMLAYHPVPPEVGQAAQAEMRDMQDRISDTLETFKISVTPGPITRGPSITRYEFYPPRGLRVNRIASLQNDLMLATSSKSVNILAPIPGKNTVGIELENATKSPVYLRELLQDPAFRDPKLRIPVALGKDVYGNSVIGDLAAMPHTLVAGTTGSGKSVCINSMILSMLYKFRPDELKLILVDPKVVEMQPYKKLPHLICPVVTNPARVIGALRWAVNEMEHRYSLFSKCGVRNFEDFNNRPPDFEPEPDEPEPEAEPVEFDVEAWASDIERQGEEGVELGEETQEELDFDADERIPSRLPYIVIIIDELADLMMVVKEDLENYIARLTQKARAAGIHLVVATQTPRSNVVTGIIKANIPSRIALKVSSPLDSRIILDTAGAENLLGKGDFLFLPPGGISKLTRAQGAWVSDAEIAAIVKFCASHAKQKFEQGVSAEMDNADGTATSPDNGGRLSGSRSSSDAEDELYTRCVNLVVTERKASTSLLQRRFSIGYGRAAKIMDLMEERGIISPPQGATRAREVLVDEP